MIAHVTARNMPTLHRHEEEKFFINDEGRKESLPSIHDPATRELSVVVPSYNEEDRCKIFLVLRKRRKSICCYSNNAEVSFMLAVVSGKTDYVSDFGQSFQRTVQVH